MKTLSLVPVCDSDPPLIAEVLQQIKHTLYTVSTEERRRNDAPLVQLVLLTPFEVSGFRCFLPVSVPLKGSV